MPESTAARKLKIREGNSLLTINAPLDFEKNLGPLPDDVEVSPSLKKYDQVHWFVKDRTQMERELKKVLALVREDVICWIYYPKGSSGMQTDLTRDSGWEVLQQQEHLQWINLISFNSTWSAFGLRRKTGADRKKEARPTERPVFDYVDPGNKTVRLPEDLAQAFKNAKKQEAFFHSLSFTNRKEYIEWIVSAKREETRATRVRETIERLGKEWKNPANR